MGKRSGGGKHQSSSDGVIYTHPDCADAIMEVVWNKISRNGCEADSDTLILDACSGEGVLGMAFLKELPVPEVILDSVRMDFVDINQPDTKAEYPVNFTCCDILNWKPRYHYGFIICNPPFDEKTATAIFNHLKTLLSKNGVLIFFNPFGWFCQSDTRCRSLGFRYIIPMSTKMYMISGTGLLHLCVGIYINDDYEDKGFVPLPHTVKELLKDKEQGLLIR